MAKRAGKGSVEVAQSDDRWRIEDALRTLTRADEIRGDKKLMGQVRQHAVKQQRTLAKVAKSKN